MKIIPYKYENELPVAGEADVIVCGGGPGGIGAAVMAARAGARTLLIERYGFLGGMATAGEVHPFMPNHVDGKPLDQPVYTDWTGKIAALWPPKEADRDIPKEAAMLAAEELCLEAGVELLYHHHCFDVVRKNGAAESLILFSKSGLSAARARIFIDCTGDGDLAALAGCEFEMGGPAGHCQPLTLCFKLCGVDKSRMPPREEINRQYDDAREKGELECPRQNVLYFNWLQDDVVHFNTTRVIQKNAVNARELSQAEIEGRKQLRQYLEFFRKRIPGFEKAQLHSTGHHIGVRETRRIKGINYITREAFEKALKFPDGIARVRYPIDIHNPGGSGTEIVHMPEGDWYEIPYGCIVARDADNLLVGGRPISVDHAIHGSMRVMPPACSVGQAAGMAAAMAAEKGRAPRDLDGTEVRARLRDRGAWL